ncbi:MAG TPA: hypothetical protein VH117_05800, partial [Edaphobacter sp.]|nr:hypothetical protein [Edaphobacter sp.]
MSYQVFPTLRSVAVAVVFCTILYATLCTGAAWSQQSAPAPASAPTIVQPGAPGSSNKTLSKAAATAGQAPKTPSK